MIVIPSIGLLENCTEGTYILPTCAGNPASLGLIKDYCRAGTGMKTKAGAGEKSRVEQEDGSGEVLVVGEVSNLTGKGVILHRRSERRTGWFR